MHTSSSVRLVADDEPVSAPTIVLLQLVRGRDHGDPLTRAIARGRQALLARLQSDGSFADPQPVSARALASLALCRVFLESHDPPQLKPIARALLDAQRADGGWSGDTSNELNMSASVLAYFALKLSDQSSASEPMVCARRAILSRGGATSIDADANIWLALFDQWPYEALERLRPTSDAMEIINTLRPRRHINHRYGIRELMTAAPRRPKPIFGRLTGWFQRQRSTIRARRSIAAVKSRLLEQIAQWKNAACPNLIPDSLALSLIALDALGMTADTLPRRCAADILDNLIDLEPEKPQSRWSADVATAATALAALRASGLDDTHADVRLGQGWLESRAFDSLPDAIAALDSNVPSSANSTELLPPVLKPFAEDECVATVASPHFPDASTVARQLLKTQRSDGAWSLKAGTFGRFHTAGPDLGTTAQFMIALASLDPVAARPALARAATWICNQQQSDGGWAAATHGAVHATSRVLQALAAAEFDATSEPVATGAAWLMAHQQAGGGWGDAFPTEQSVVAGEGPVTAQHTAAALLGLLAAGHGEHKAVADGIRYLLSTQTADGEWPLTARGVLETAEPLLALAAYARQPRRAGNRPLLSDGARPPLSRSKDED